MSARSAAGLSSRKKRNLAAAACREHWRFACGGVRGPRVRSWRLRQRLVQPGRVAVAPGHVVEDALQCPAAIGGCQSSCAGVSSGALDEQLDVRSTRHSQADSSALRERRRVSSNVTPAGAHPSVGLASLRILPVDPLLQLIEVVERVIESPAAGSCVASSDTRNPSRAPMDTIRDRVCGCRRSRYTRSERNQLLSARPGRRHRLEVERRERFEIGETGQRRAVNAAVASASQRVRVGCIEIRELRGCACHPRMMTRGDLMTGIRSLAAQEILDSRGNPTVAVVATLEDGSTGLGGRPLGAPAPSAARRSECVMRRPAVRRQRRPHRGRERRRSAGEGGRRTRRRGSARPRQGADRR